MADRKANDRPPDRAGDGNREALDQLVPFVYDELRRSPVASFALRSEAGTRDTGALVHEAYLKLVQLDRMQWQSRAHFLAIAAQAMRNILVNHALRRKRAKRGGGARMLRSRRWLQSPRSCPVIEADRILALDAATPARGTQCPSRASSNAGFFGA
jgi:RNA polymerase sigma factor (TIGR02999 family)